eukprot:jgi/Bigna1/129386/aug1.9_g4094
MVRLVPTGARLSNPTSRSSTIISSKVFPTMSLQNSFQSFFSTNLQKTEAPPSLPEKPWISKATRDFSEAKSTNLPVSARKLNDIARPVRGLSCDEAIIQLKLSPKPKSSFVSRLIQNAKNNGIHNFNMDPDRLYVAEIQVGKGQQAKKLRYHGRGRMGIMTRYRSHLKVKVMEQPWQEGEIRIGRRGRRISVIKDLKKRHEEANEKYADILEDFGIEDED